MVSRMSKMDYRIIKAVREQSDKAVHSFECD